MRETLIVAVRKSIVLVLAKPTLLLKESSFPLVRPSVPNYQNQGYPF